MQSLDLHISRRGFWPVPLGILVSWEIWSGKTNSLLHKNYYNRFNCFKANFWLAVSMGNGKFRKIKACYTRYFVIIEKKWFMMWRASSIKLRMHLGSWKSRQTFPPLASITWRSTPNHEAFLNWIDLKFWMSLCPWFRLVSFGFVWFGLKKKVLPFGKTEAWNTLLTVISSSIIWKEKSWQIIK